VCVCVRVGVCVCVCVVILCRHYIFLLDPTKKKKPIWHEWRHYWTHHVLSMQMDVPPTEAKRLPSQALLAKREQTRKGKFTDYNARANLYHSAFAETVFGFPAHICAIIGSLHNPSKGEVHIKMENRFLDNSHINLAGGPRCGYLCIKAEEPLEHVFAQLACATQRRRSIRQLTLRFDYLIYEVNGMANNLGPLREVATAMAFSRAQDKGHTIGDLLAYSIGFAEAPPYLVPLSPRDEVLGEICIKTRLTHDKTPYRQFMANAKKKGESAAKAAAKKKAVADKKKKDADDAAVDVCSLIHEFTQILLILHSLSLALSYSRYPFLPSLYLSAFFASYPAAFRLCIISHTILVVIHALFTFIRAPLCAILHY
jgi:hypothetical protein